MPDGVVDIGIANKDGGRSVIKTLSDIQSKAKYLFKGVDAKELSTSLKEVNSDIKKTEAEAKKAKAAFDDLMSGQTEPQSVKNIRTELETAQTKLTETKTKLDDLLSGTTEPKAVQRLAEQLKTTEAELLKAQMEHDKLIAKADKLTDKYGTELRLMSEYGKQQITENNSQLSSVEKRMMTLEKEASDLAVAMNAVKMNPEATNQAKSYQNQIQQLQQEVVRLQTLENSLRQNPQLTEEAQQYTSALVETEDKLTSLKGKQRELNAEVKRNQVINDQSSKSVLAGLGKIEKRIIRLAKRVFFFSLITKALRGFRKQVGAAISADSQLADSLAQVKGNLATAFGSIWVSVLPALRALINALAIATKYLAAFISWLTGKSLKQGVAAYQAMAAASADTAGNTGKVSKAAKKAAKALQRMLMPFDEMNVLSKDTEDNTEDTGADGEKAGIGMTFPTEGVDNLIKKFGQFKDLIILIGAAFAAWKLTPLVASLLKITGFLGKLRVFAGLTLLIAGITLLTRGIIDLIKNGPSVSNVCDIIAGGLMTIAGVLLLLGNPIGWVLGLIGLLVLGFKTLYEKFEPFKEYVDGALERIKKAFSEGGFKGIIKGVFQIGKEIFFGILKGIAWVAKKIGKWLKKHIWDPIVNGIKKLFGISSPAKETMPLGEMITQGLLEGMLKPIRTVGTWIKNKVFKPIKDALFGNKSEGKEGLFVKIGAKFTDTKDGIKKKWTKLTSDVKDKTAEMKAAVKQKWKDIRKKWEELTDNVKTKTADMKAKVPQTWSSIKTNWTNLTQNVKNKTADMKAKVPQRWANIKSAWVNLTQNVKNKTADMKARVASRWSELRGTWNTLMSNFRDKVVDIKMNIGTSVKSAKDFVNDIIYKLNTKLGNLKWPSWVPGIGGDWVFSSGNPIPYLARGAVIPPNKQFLAVLGDQKSGTNIETPLQTMIDAFNTALAQNGVAGGPTEVNVYLQGDAKQIFKVVRTEANNYVQSTGKAAFNL